MTTDQRVVTVGGMRVTVVRKRIRNLHLGVYPPDGRVRVAAPAGTPEAAVRTAVVRKLAWIRRQQEAFRSQERASAREMVSGESHYFLGLRYRLQVEESETARGVVLRGKVLKLHVRPGSTLEGRERALQRWYRERLRELIPPLVTKWERALGISVAGWGIKRMKTKWGSSNSTARRVWFNLELAKKPIECLEYLVVHELVHCLAPRHDDRFTSLMDRHIPRWRFVRTTLNSAPLAHERWNY